MKAIHFNFPMTTKFFFNFAIFKFLMHEENCGYRSRNGNEQVKVLSGNVHRIVFNRLADLVGNALSQATL